jgi:hypothetical protein
MVFGSTQPVREMKSRENSWGVDAIGAYSWHLHEPILWKSGNLNLLESSGPLQACIGIVLPVTVAETEAEVAAFCSLWGVYKCSMGGEIIYGIFIAVDYLVTSAKSFPINDSTCSDTAVRFNISSLKFCSKDN